MRSIFPEHLLRLRYLREFVAPRALSWQALSGDAEDSLETHRRNIQQMYLALFGYLERVPSYHVGEDEATEMMIRCLQKIISSNEVSLMVDLCSGFGKSTRLLSEAMSCRVIGIDLVLQQALVAQARAAGLSANFVAGDVRSPPLRPNIFDVAWSEDAFSHVPRRNVLLREIRTLLKPGGLLVFSDLIKRKRLTEQEEMDFCWAWCLAPLESLTSYKAKLREAGFRLEQAEDIGQQVFAAHLRADSSRADAPYREYRDWLQGNKEALIGRWGEEAFRVHLFRLKMYDYLSGGCLTHGFFVARS